MDWALDLPHGFLEPEAQLPTNDPNMDLLASPGKLQLTSTHADLNQSPGPTGSNLPLFEAPGVFVPGVGSADVTVKALFENVHVPNGSDHLMVYAGVNENLVLSAGIHQLDVYMVTKNLGVGDINTFTPPDSFSPGDNIEISLSRNSGIWSLSWKNLTDFSSGSVSGIAFPELNAHSDLYFGVLASNAGLTSQGVPESFTAQIDYFSVDVAPETTSFFAFSLAGIYCAFLRHR